jgi:FAD synthase
MVVWAFNVLPRAVRLRGEVIRGFGRGSKQLGFATANLASSQLQAELSQMERGIYCGFASVRNETFPMVMSIGWNPQFHEDQKELFVVSRSSKYSFFFFCSFFVTPVKLVSSSWVISAGGALASQI